MDKEDEFKPGDVIQHKATGLFGVVLTEEDQDKKVTVRKSDGIEFTYFIFELVAVSDDVEESRLEKFRRHEQVEK